MALQKEIQVRIDQLPDNIREVIKILLQNIDEQKKSNITDTELKERLNTAIQESLAKETTINED